MIIPKSFKLAGITVTVNEDNNLVANKHAIGESRYATQSISIDTSAAPLEMTCQSFYHEATHWILYIMGEEELRNNEKFVDLFAQFWYQYETTKEGALNAPKKTEESIDRNTEGKNSIGTKDVILEKRRKKPSNKA